MTSQRLASRRVMAEDLVEVHMKGVPLAIHQRAGEHSAEIMREFAHLVEGPSAADAPARLIVLDRVLQAAYQRFSQGTSDQLDAALSRGDTEADLVYTVPKEAGAASEAYQRIWEEVDAYCADGKYLLALRSPPDVAAYRRWVTGEFVKQTAGGPPMRWSDWLRRLPESGGEGGI